MMSPHLPFLKKKLGLSYLIWLQKGNKYLLLEEPAWFVLNELAKNKKPSVIAAECTNRYGNPEAECLTFVLDIHSSIDQMNQPAEISADTGPIAEKLSLLAFQPYSIQYYQFGDTLIKFSYQSEVFESYLHPLISHLESSEIMDNISHFELFDFENKVVFRLNGEVKGIWGYEETHLVKGLIFMNLINVMFDKTDDFWLMTVHASAITNGKKTILISAAPGSGKTTMAAMLQNQGYRMVSDDFVPIDRHAFCAWPFPIAMSVKQGAVKLLSSIYPNLEQKPVNYITSEKSVRYVFPNHAHQQIDEAFPVKEFIFIQYDPATDFKCEKLPLANAVKLLLDQSWISPRAGTAKILLEQLPCWSFYQLTYSNNQKALDTIGKLFDHD